MGDVVERFRGCEAGSGGKTFLGQSDQVRMGEKRAWITVGFGRVQNFWATFAAFSGGQEGRNGGSRRAVLKGREATP